MAELYACAGEKKLALDWLERAYEDRRIEMVYLGVRPTWDIVRSEPRFQALLARMKLPTNVAGTDPRAAEVHMPPTTIRSDADRPA